MTSPIEICASKPARAHRASGAHFGLPALGLVLVSASLIACGSDTSDGGNGGNGGNGGHASAGSAGIGNQAGSSGAAAGGSS
jgi:hypothetical protein